MDFNAGAWKGSGRSQFCRSILPVSAVIPTADRSVSLAKCLETLVSQSVRVKEVIVVDASGDGETKALCERMFRYEHTVKSAFSGDYVDWRVIYVRARTRGAASQRNEGVAAASEPFILFVDDDVELQQDCLKRLWAALMSDDRTGGVSSMIENQQYAPPGIPSRMLFRFLSGRRLTSYAGKVLGPGLNLLPEDREDLPELVPVEWLHLMCTLFRRDGLPSPVFPHHFTGYSIGEDVNLSLTVGKRWKLVNARTARIYHYSLPGIHKKDPMELARMSLVNRHYIMTETLVRREYIDYVKLSIWELFSILVSLCSREDRQRLPAVLAGKLKGIAELLR